MSVQGNKLLGSLFPSYLEAHVYPDVHSSNLLSFCTCRERVEPRSKIIELHAENVPIFSLQKTFDHDRDNWNAVGPWPWSKCSCHYTAVGVESNAIFMVDLKYLKHTKDIMCDVLGSWKNNGCHSTLVIVDADGIAETRGKSSQMLPVMVVFCTEYVKGTMSTRQPRLWWMIVVLECMCISVSTMCVWVVVGSMGDRVWLLTH